MPCAPPGCGLRWRILLTRIRRCAPILIVASLSLTACSETGDPAVYDQIDATSDCGVLETMFADFEASEESSDQAGDDGAAGEFRSYADATQRRMDDLGCD